MPAESVPSSVVPIFSRTSLAGMLSALLLLTASGAVAGERISLYWVNAASGETFQVTSPSAAPLSAVKSRVMAELGLVPGAAANYRIERSVVTATQPTRDPNNPGQTIWVPVEQSQALDEAKRLGDLALANGDTLKLVKVAEGRPGRGR